MSVIKQIDQSNNLMSISAEASGDLSSHQYKCVIPKDDGSNTVMCVAAPTTAGERCIGILQNAPTDGLTAEVMVLGVSKCVAAGTFSPGVELSVADVNGRVDDATTTQYSIGIALEEATAANQVVSVLLMPRYKV